MLLLPTLFSIPQAQAVQEIVITEPTYRMSDGIFIDDQLALKLAPSGSLGVLIYAPTKAVRSWQIDPATIAEIVAMLPRNGCFNSLRSARMKKFQ